eukprot:6536838-Prymnesium_polylepis.1
MGGKFLGGGLMLAARRQVAKPAASAEAASPPSVGPVARTAGPTSQSAGKATQSTVPRTTQSAGPTAAAGRQQKAPINVGPGQPSAPGQRVGRSQERQRRRAEREQRSASQPAAAAMAPAPRGN